MELARFEKENEVPAKKFLFQLSFLIFDEFNNSEPLVLQIKVLILRSISFEVNNWWSCSAHLEDVCVYKSDYTDQYKMQLKHLFLVLKVAVLLGDYTAT